MGRTQFPFVGVTPAIIDGKHITAMGDSIWLFMHLVCRQTDPRGAIAYGRPLTYARIRKDIPNAPGERKFRRWLDRLQKRGYVEVRHTYSVGTGRGMILRIANPKKWASQLRLPFVQKPVEKQCETTPTMRPDLAGRCGQIWPHKDVRLKKEHREVLPAGTAPAAATLIRNIRKIQRLDREAAAIRTAYAGSRDSDGQDDRLQGIENQILEARTALEELEIYEREATA